MLSFFRIQNYKSILDMKVDFSYAEGKAPNNYDKLTKMPFLEISSNNTKDRFVPCMAFYGANASGKSNIIDALFEYQYILKKGIENCYEPNRLNTKYTATIFEIEFICSNIKYRHLIQYDENEIKTEELLKNEELVYSIKNSSIEKECDFSGIKTEQYNNEKLKNILFVECSEQKDKSYLQKKSFMSVVSKQYSGLSQDIVIAMEEIQRITILESNNITKSVLRILNDSSDNELLFKDISNIIKKFDIDIVRMVPSKKNLELENDDIKKIYDFILKTSEKTDFYEEVKRLNRRDFINTYHKTIEDKEVVFDMQRDESKGTNILFGLIAVFLIAFSQGGVVVIDELDSSIHPLVLAKLVEMFKNRKYNKKNAQLIFTVHCADILDMDVLRVSEVAIIKKTLHEGSTFRRISDFEKIRNVTNFRKLYLSGAFSGIPFPYI